MNGADLIAGILKQEGIEYLRHCDMNDAAAQSGQDVAANIRRKLPAGL